MSQSPILLVDDEEAVRESLGAWLREDGYQVETAPDGQAALDKLARHAYGVLLLDLKMPGLDGLQVLVEAKKRQPDLVAILMTAFATVDTAVQAMKQGAHDYLVKPFDPEELSQLVQRLTRETALHRQDGGRLSSHPIVRRE